MERKGQGAIEYLLIIGAAILVVAIVILAVTGALGGAKGSVASTGSDVNSALCQVSCTALDSNCSSNGTTAINCAKAAPNDCNWVSSTNWTCRHK